MALLGQASGGFTESSSALRILHVGVRNTLGQLTSDSFIQTNPPIISSTATDSQSSGLTLVSGVIGVLSAIFNKNRKIDTPIALWLVAHLGITFVCL